MLKVKAISLVVAALLCASSARAEDKGQFTLFNPTPRALMREMLTDRPDTTESPYTVDAGHFQVELSLIEYAHDRQRGVTTDTIAALPSNVKVGLLNNVDLQLVFAPYVNQRIKVAGASARNDGFGDTIVRLKANFFGNDGGAVAVGIMPYVKSPTAANDLGNGRVEGGLILPLAVQLPAGFDLGTMLEIDVLRNAANNGYGTGLLHTATLGHAIFGKLSGYVEYAGTTFVRAGSSYLAVVGTGLTYGIGEDVQFDVGANFGISHSANDYNVFVGLSFRI
jgi:hypothetical protein